MPVVLFISDKKYVKADIQGGVQLCTQEYIKYIKLAGYDLQEFHVETAISTLTRLKIKAGIDAYERRYNVVAYLDSIVQTVEASGIKLIAFNQLDLAFWVKKIKERVAPDVRFVGLSHGNESGDYLHDIAKPGPPTALQRWKLGRLLVKEAHLFSRLLDGVIVLNEDERAINQWLGASNTLYLPRILTPSPVGWKPGLPKAGFAATLDHLPNFMGIQQVADELQASNFRHKIRLVGGPPKIGTWLAANYTFLEYLGPVSDIQLNEEIKTWSVFLNTVLWQARGSSTKLASAISKGIPCLTTPAGRRGYVLSNEAIVTADNSSKTFAKALISVLDDADSLQRLKIATDENANNFDISPWVQRLQGFLNRLT